MVERPTDVLKVIGLSEHLKVLSLFRSLLSPSLFLFSAISLLHPKLESLFASETKPVCVSFTKSPETSVVFSSLLVFSNTSWKHCLKILSQQGRRRKDQSRAKNNIKKIMSRNCNATLSVTTNNSNWTTINTK